MEKSTKTDLILDTTNRINTSKNTNVLYKKDLANTIVDISELYAKKIKAGKENEEDIENFSEFSVSKNYFTIEHEDLERANKEKEQFVNFALYELDSKKSFSRGMKKAS